MAGTIDDCTASFSIRSMNFPCGLPYLHDGDAHECILWGEEQRVFRYGQIKRRDLATVLRWPKGDVSYELEDRDAIRQASEVNYLQ